MNKESSKDKMNIKDKHEKNDNINTRFERCNYVNSINERKAITIAICIILIINLLNQFQTTKSSEEKNNFYSSNSYIK